jgi:pyruvate dehydrogenase E1 component
VASYTTLGTDGFGRSDTRVALRGFFEVDRFHIALAALEGLARGGAVDAELVMRAITRYAIEPDSRAPWNV